MKKFKRLLALVMAVTMLAGMVPANVMPVEAKPGEPANAEQTQDETLAVENETRAGSEVVDAAIIFTDLHTSSNDYKENTIKAIFSKLQSTGLPFSSVTSGGDAFSVNADNTKYTGKTKDISEDIRTALGKADIPVNYVWSDHDRYAVKEDERTLLDKTSHLVYGAGNDGEYGTEDDGNYYVYALSMGDLGSYDRYSSGFNSDARAGKGFTATIDLAIDSFEADAAKLKKDRPLFIVSHQPLFNRRNDNAFAEQWFDAINKVAEEMDVAFFFGHNHKYDQAGDYYYAKGSTMPVATADNWKSYETGQGNGGKPSVTLSARNKTLNFTHMCAGYMAPSSTGSTSNTTRQGTVMAITIYEDSIGYCTYNNAGKYTDSYAVNETVKRDHAVSEPEEVPVEKDALEAAIAAAETLVADDYVDFTAVAEALATAKTVAADEDATQEAVNAALEALNAAMDALEEKAEEPDTPAVPEGTEITVDNTTVKVSGATVKESSAVKDEDKALVDAMNYEDVRVVDIDAEITGEEAALEFSVPAEWQDKTDRIVGISVENGEVKSIQGKYADGSFTFYVSHFSAKGIALVAENGEAGDTENVARNNNYPEYPHEGAVKVNKTGTGIDFQSSGIAQVEISASGVPVKKGADLIIMLDTSSSMTKNNVTGTNKTRAKVLEESLANLITQLKTPGDDGETLDIKVAIADFNGYYGDGSGGTSGTPYDRTSGDYVKNGNSNGSGYNQASQARVYTGSKALNKDAFLSVDKLADTYTLNYTSGTNYDYAFDAIYQLGTAIKAANTEERDLYVIFMSDGASLQWNYFGTQNTYTKWNNWLAGTWKADELTTTNLNSTKHSYFYDLNDHDGDGHINEHRMANAIKGDPNQRYEIIRKSTAGLPDDTLVSAGKDYLYTVPGLGATMFTINFDAKQDGQITVDSIDKALASTASDQTGTTQYYYKVTTADALMHAFDAIGSEIAYAASNARFVDQMGDDYNLQMKTSTYTVVNGTSTTNKTVTPKIEIISYDIYTQADAEAGKIPEDKHIGDRKGTYKILETVTFKSDGTEAYSDQIDGGKTNILAKNTENGYVEGVIYAKTFLYNTNVADVAVNGVNIPTGTNEDGTTSGSTNVLPSETFYWKMGTVQTSELAMRYYVYLEGSMEGTRPAGSYPTNEYANLYYDNYLGNPCQKPTVSPVLAWKEANVSYAFYLVDENGKPIVNQTTGQTGTFANKIAVTNPVVYKTVTLNSSQAVEADVVAKNVLPEGYTLYDAVYDDNGNLTDGASYEITINSNSTGSWTITSKQETATTYVTQYDPNNASAYSNEKQMDITGNDYTHTVVWFAVVWSIQAIPDTVVIDYGLPVDISVLSNDMFGENGKLAAIGANRTGLSEYTSTLAEGFGASYTGTYGTAEANTTTGKVRYTPANMQMNGYDKFAYAVNYTRKTENSSTTEYYYDTVTVIPATTIYYEDDFVTYSSYTWSDTDNKWKPSETDLWSSEGTKIANATQGEDRPGKYSLSDANNIYGYDSVNKGMSTHSLGSARKATVDYDNYAQASFTFYGTGFDIISMTSNMTGTILVDVERKDGDTWKEFDNFAVDTYYGYKQVAGDADKDGTVEKNEMIWVVDPDSKDSLYQVPVIKMVDQPYGQYRVTIKATYDSFFDHVDPSNENGSYDFYLDAVRIYDPANDGAVDNDTMIEDAYKADGEGWPSYIELRNKLIKAKSFDDVANGALTTDMEGLVFIDGDESVGDAQLADYVAYGPNNEVYLKPGQRVAFMVDAPANLANLRIGIKSADGQPATYTITNIAKENSTDGKVKAGDWYNAKTSAVDTATDMYYDLTGWKGDIIVISNTGNNQASTGGQNTKGIISLTTIKSTYTSDPNVNNGVAAASLDDAFTGNETSVYMTPAAAMLTLRTLNMPKEDITTPDEEVTTPEVAIFAPEKLEVKVHKDKVKTGEKVNVTVTTSSDVEVIEINGSEITDFRTTKHGERKWEAAITAEEAGTMIITIVAKNSDSNSSEPITKFVEVTKKVFKPKKFDVKLQKDKVKTGQKVKVIVTTSADVEVIEINGSEITTFKAKGKAERTREITLTPEEAGVMEIIAVVKDKDGNSSEPTIKQLEVTKKKGR